MKITSALANKELKSLNEKKDMLIEIEKQNSIFTVEKSEDTELNRPPFDFEKNYNELQEVCEKIRLIKHAINVFNTTTLVGNTGMTVDEVLVALPMLRERKRALSELAIKNPRERTKTMYRYSNNFIEYDIINYSLDYVKKELEKTDAKINELLLQLDKTNSTIEFEINTERS